jgi:hypothetical protein
MLATRKDIILTFKPDKNTTETLAYHTNPDISVTRQTDKITKSIFFSCCNNTYVATSSKKHLIVFPDEQTRDKFEGCLINCNVNTAQHLINSLPAPYNEWAIYYGVSAFLAQFAEFKGTENASMTINTHPSADADKDNHVLTEERGLLLANK